jgi:DNA-binding phage protein
MAKKFDDLLSEIQESWTDEDWRVYEAASAVLRAEMDERAQLGAQLAAVRKARGLTQPALSKLSGIQQAEISRIERGAGNPTAATLLRLANALGQQITLVPTQS